MTTSATLALNYTRTVSPHFTSETSLGYIRSTPLFLSPNHTQPAMTFADSLYEPFNSAAGTATGAYGNLYQLRQNFIYAHGTHTLKFGVEIRFNRDTTIFGVNPDGTYTFGGGAAYAPVEYSLGEWPARYPGGRSTSRHSYGIPHRHPFLVQHDGGVGLHVARRAL